MEKDKEEGLVEQTNGDMKIEKMLETPKMMHTRTFGGPPISLESRTVSLPIVILYLS